MPILSITLSAAAVAELNDAFASLYGYRDTIDGEANPQTKAQFARQQVIEFLKERVQTHRRAEALKAANAATPDIT